LGYAPDSDERIALQAGFERESRRIRDDRAASERQLAEGRDGFITKIESFSVFVDTERYSQRMIEALRNGGYEGGERSIVNSALRSNDRVIEVGTAVGAVSMTAAKKVGAENVMTFDANPAMTADARRNFAANKLGGIKASVGVLRNRRRWVDDETEIDFYVARDFWASRLFAKADSEDIVQVVKVPLVCFEDKVRDHGANVLICDIEGGEADLLDDANLEPIRLILMEIHYWAVGRARIDNMIRILIGQGFNVNFSYTNKNIVVLDRSL
jgi:FkbM family methyltransferase